MMLASGQVCYGCSKAGTSPLWFGVTLTVRSDRPKTPTHNTRNSALLSFLVTFRRSQASTSCGAADLSGILQKLIWPPRPPRVESLPSCFSTTDLGPDPEPTRYSLLHSVHLLPHVLVLFV